jgi:transcriptional regulator with XRE-family HTH domain
LKAKLPTLKKTTGDQQRSVDLDVGIRIRRLRNVRGLSLAEVSARSGLSAGFLSQIERGISSASIRALARIAEALEAAIGDIFQMNDSTEGENSFVSRHEDRKIVAFPEMKASKELLTPFPGVPRLDMYILTMEPGGTSGEQPFSHSGQEAGLIIQGGIELIVDGQKAILGEGDSFRFASSRQHQYRNAGSVVAKAIWINYTDAFERDPLTTLKGRLHDNRMLEVLREGGLIPEEQTEET